MVIYRLDGIDFEPGFDYEPLSGFTISASLTESKITRSFGQSATFYNNAYEYIKQKLIINPNRLNERIIVEVIDTCCNEAKFLQSTNLNPTEGVLYTGQIDSKSIDWCEGDCAIKAKIVELNPDIQAATCLGSTYIWDNKLGFQQKQHPFIRYCIELRPGFIQDLMFIFGLIFYLLILMTLQIVLVINLVIIIVNFLITFLSLGYADLDEISDAIFDFLGDILEKIRGYISGCARGHPAPLIRDYIQNVCDICGLTFQSSILNNPNSPYYNALWLEASVRKGERDYATWIDDNKPLLTGEKFLDTLSLAFNGKYSVRNGVLIFERKDYFQTNVLWVDADPTTNEDIIEVCYRFPATDAPAFTSFETQLDGVDWVGNEAKSYYNDIVEWKTPFAAYPTLKGERKQLLPFSPARFRRDGIDRDVISEYYDLFDSIGLGFVIVDDDYNNALLLPVEICFTPKILIWDGNSPNYQNAQIIRQQISLGGDTFYYNAPMWICAGTVSPNGLPLGQNLTSKPYLPNNLFEKFWFIDDPRFYENAGKEFRIRMKRTCKYINDFNFDSYVLMPNDIATNVRFKGVVKEIQISESEIVISGIF